MTDQAVRSATGDSWQGCCQSGIRQARMVPLGVQLHLQQTAYTCVSPVQQCPQRDCRRAPSYSVMCSCRCTCS